MLSSVTRELHRPHGLDPSSFYEAVAITCNEALTRTSVPMTVLAAEADIPMPTASLRGLLLLGRKGRAE